MLKITIPEREYFNEDTQEFVMMKKQELVLEHSVYRARRILYHLH